MIANEDEKLQCVQMLAVKRRLVSLKKSPLLKVGGAAIASSCI